MQVAVLGAGNGGQAMAGYLTSRGCEVRLWNRSEDPIRQLSAMAAIRLEGAIEVEVPIAQYTTNLKEAVDGANLIFVTTTADAHESLVAGMADHLRNGQVLVLSPGRTGGALVSHALLKRIRPELEIAIGETQSLLFACRRIRNGHVRIIGVKSVVPFAAYPRASIRAVEEKVSGLSSAFVSSDNVLVTSFENIGSILHPAILLFNAAVIERHAKFYFYREMTKGVSRFLVRLDQERLRLGTAYGLGLIAIGDWIRTAYPESRGDSLCELMQSNPAYYDIQAPEGVDSRMLTEDIPTGLVPLVEFGRAAGVDMPLARSLVDIGGALLGRDFWKEGRSLEKMGLGGLSREDILIKVMG